MKKNNAGGGIIAAIIIIVGILLATGVISPSSAALANILKLVGIGCAVVGGAILAIVVAVIVASFKANKPDPDSAAKAEVNQAIAESTKQLAKMKSAVNVMQMDLRRTKTKIDDIDRNIKYCDMDAEKYVREKNDAKAAEAIAKKQGLIRQREKLVANEKEYEKNLARIQKMVDEYAAEVKAMRERRDDAYAKMKLAEAKDTMNAFEEATRNQMMNGVDDVALAELEEKAQYQADYMAAMKQLENPELFEKYDNLAAEYDAEMAETSRIQEKMRG